MEPRLKVFDLSIKRWLFFFTHPDDEISIVAWIKRLCDSGATVHCAWTVSKPVREAEARAMVGSLGVPQENMHFYDAPDGDACDHIPEVIQFANGVIETAQPDRIALGAFECGHIDHDSTNFAVAHANQQRVPMFEIPFYHTYLTNVPVINRFADPSGEELIQLSPTEQTLKVRASRAYKSQNIGSLLFWYTALNLGKLKPAALCKTERMRLQLCFDYLTPNLPPKLCAAVQQSEKFRRFALAIRNQGDSWRVVQDHFLPVFREELRRLVPQLQPVSDNDDGLYIWAGELSTFLREHANDPSIAENCFEFINTACEKGGHETHQIIWIEFFEVAEAYPNLQPHFDNYLKGKARDLYSEFWEWRKQNSS